MWVFKLKQWFCESCQEKVSCKRIFLFVSVFSVTTQWAKPNRSCSLTTGRDFLLLRVNFSPANYVLFTQWYPCNHVVATIQRYQFWENFTSLSCYYIDTVNLMLASEGLSLRYWQDRPVSSSVICQMKIQCCVVRALVIVRLQSRRDLYYTVLPLRC